MNISDWIGMISLDLIIILAIHLMIKQAKEFDNNSF